MDMVTGSTAARTKARLQFFALYLFSALLIFVAVATVLKNRWSAPVVQTADENTQPQSQAVNANVIAEIEQYKEAINVRNHVIDSLNAQISTQSANQTTPVQQPQVVSNDGEWKQKYAALKSSYDKAIERENTLKSSYKTVVDDNKRLLQQIQNLKKD
ncbi:MAG: hypothetical protein EOO53_21990 [Gammaproteobacteria bacterium]|nr:MAG: hypothetical protein EOO53_21990 [Gammaproteobacteria bacterium]